MKYSVMKENDIEIVIQLYMDYYNNHEDSIWTEQTTYKRIHQVFNMNDSYCLLLECEDAIIGFAMGYFEQYDDLKAYDLVEIIIDYKYQNQGIGIGFMLELEQRVKGMGASMIQLQAVNDNMHNNFYGKLNYKNATNLIIKSKWL